MSARMKLAFACYLAAIAGLGAWGVMFMFRGEFMPYHAVAAGMPWAEVPPSFQVIILALYKLAGGAWAVVALALSLMLFGPFRQGSTWAQRAIPIVLLVQGAVVINAMAFITLRTDANPPWVFTIAVMVITVAGFLLSMGSKRGG